MVFDYTVKHDGIVYPAGTDVPVGNMPKKEEPKVVETKVEPKVEEPVQETQPKAKPFKKTTKKK